MATATQAIENVQPVVTAGDISFLLSDSDEDGRRKLIVLGDNHGHCAVRMMTSEEYDHFVTQLMSHSKRLSKFLPVTGRY